MTDALRSALRGVVLVSLLAAACGGGGGAATSSPAPPESAQIAFPERILGLRVEPADIADRLEGAEQPFVDSVGMFTMREDDLLRATFQASRFTQEARPEDPEFRGAILSRIGTTAPREVRVGDQQVFITSGQNQNVFIWFREQGFFVLTVTREFGFPRTLLRRVLDLGLEL